jgi:hypothetical protein
MYSTQVGFETLFRFRLDKAQYLSNYVETSSTTAIYFAVGWCFSLLSTVSILRFGIKNNKLKYRIVYAVFAAAPALILANPISTGRYIFACVYLSILLAIIYRPNPAINKAIKISFVAGLLLVFPFLNVFRTKNFNAGSSALFADFTGGDYDAFSQLINMVEYTKATGALLSDQFLGPLLFFVPRQFWQDKPLDSGALIANFKGYGFTNLSAPIWAELLVSFSWLGVLLGFYLIGNRCLRMDTGLKGASSSPESNVLYFPIAIYSLILYRGSLLQAFGAFCLMLLGGFLLRSRKKRVSSRNL